MVSKKIPIFDNYQIMHQAYLDFPAMLKSLPVWLNKMHYDFYEKGLTEKDIGTGHYVESKWTAFREVTDYYKFDIDVIFYALDIKKVVFEDGENSYWARLTLTINSSITLDYNNKFSDSAWDKLMQKLYERYLVKKRTNDYITKLAIETTDMINTLKSYLK